MRNRLLIISVVAAMSLVSLAGAASADTTVTATVTCSGAYAYSNSYSVSVETLPAGVTLPQSYTRSFKTLKGLETCTVTIA